MSSSKRNILQFHNITAGDMSANVTSPVTNIQFLDNIGIQLNFSGAAPVGNFQIQVSADYLQDSLGNVQNAGNWVPLTLSYLSGGTVITDVNIPSSVGSPIYLDINQLSSPWLRVAYIRTSGTGTLDGYLTAKMIG